jgi:hypothetical protein
MAIFPFGIQKCTSIMKVSTPTLDIHNQKIWCKNGKIQELKIHTFPKFFRQPKAIYHSLENV